MSRDEAFEARFAAAYTEAKAYSATLDGPSLAERLARLAPEARAEILASLMRSERAALAYAWPLWARPKQSPPFGGHRNLLFLAGRGFGKSRTAAERVRQHIARGARSILLVGPTHREVLRYMVGGRTKNGSGLLDVYPPHERVAIDLKQEKGEILFPSGATVHLASDEAPELRGGSYDVVWCDEPVKWRHFAKVWSNIEFSLRLKGAVEPEVIITTTPKPAAWLRELVADPDTLTIVGTTDENASNLDTRFIKRLERKFGNSRIGRQERGGELLGDVEGALFSAAVLDANRVAAAPALVRVVVAIDPAIATGRDNDLTGILALGIDADGHVFVLGDASGKLDPEAWGRASVRLYDQHHADAFVAERNRGGDLVRANLNATIRQAKGQHATAKIVEVHASRGKHIRAEPVATLAEQGRLHIVGSMPALEDEITTWSPALGGPSPNRLDALVWGAFELARLADSEEPRPDPREGFKGITALQQAITEPRPMHSGRGRSLTELIAIRPGGGRI